MAERRTMHYRPLRAASLLVWAVAALGCGGPSKLVREEKAPSLPVVQKSDLRIEVLEPKSLDGLARPYTKVVVHIPGAKPRGLRVSLNGSVLLREGDRYKSIYPIPLRRDGGWLRVEADEIAMGGLNRHVFCLRYTCSIEPTHDDEMIALMRKVESPVGQDAAGANLRLQEMVDERYFDVVAERLRQSQEWYARRRLAMLLGNWRAHSAVPVLLDVLRDDESRKVRQACIDSLFQIKPMWLDTHLSDFDFDPVDVERSFRQRLLPLVPQMMKELFPQNCEEAVSLIPR